MTVFNRDHLIQKLSEKASWDIIVIGGGATGLGIAVDAASRGYTTLLLEEHDFAKGTSSRSTKLIHGGVRYLAQGMLGLIYAALHERGILLQNAPHLVKKLSFILPCYTHWEKINYLLGLKMYDWLSGRLSLGSSQYLSSREVQERLPNLKHQGLRGGVEYFDSQFDDARLAINLAQTCVEKEGIVLNYFKVTRLIKDKNGKIGGVCAVDMETDEEYCLHAKTVINATGVFTDSILRLDQSGHQPQIRISQGAHMVVDSSFLPGPSALLIPKTVDGRVLYMIPWQGYALIGTTDTPMENYAVEPVALKQEVRLMLTSLQPYLSLPPGEKDIRSLFAGLRPLAAPQHNIRHTKNISRDHRLTVSPSGLITLTGGKWTTYRKMAEDAVEKAMEVGRLPAVPCCTQQLKIHGYTTGIANDDPLAVYGSDAAGIRRMQEEDPLLAQRLINKFSYTEAEVLWAVRNEMARTPEDVLARRLRILFLDAQAAVQMAPRVAGIIKKELDRSEEWKQKELNRFFAVAQGYLPYPEAD